MMIGTLRYFLLRLALLAFAVQAGLGGAVMAQATEQGHSICSPYASELGAEAKAAARQFAALTEKHGQQSDETGSQCFLCHLVSAGITAPANAPLACLPAERTERTPLHAREAIAALPQGPPLGGRAPPFLG